MVLVEESLVLKLRLELEWSMDAATMGPAQLLRYGGVGVF